MPSGRRLPGMMVGGSIVFPAPRQHQCKDEGAEVEVEVEVEDEDEDEVPTALEKQELVD